MYVYFSIKYILSEVYSAGNVGFLSSENLCGFLNTEVKPQDTPPIQLKPAFVRSPASRRGLSGTKPVPPIPRGVSPLTDKTEVGLMGQKNGESEDIWLNERKKKLAIDLSELNINEKELDEEEVGFSFFPHECIFLNRNISCLEFRQSKFT